MKTLLALFLAGSVTFAQQSQKGKNKQHRNNSPEKRLAQMTKVLGLTDAQVTKIKTIQASQKAERDLADLDRSDRMKQFQAKRKIRRDKVQEKIKTLLNDTQKTQFTEFMSKQRQQMNKQQKNQKGKNKGGFKKPNPKALLKKMTKALDLSDEQVTSIAAIQKVQQSEQELLQIKHKKQMEKMQEKRAEKMEKIKARIKAVLTPEQQKKFETMQANRKKNDQKFGKKDCKKGNKKVGKKKCKKGGNKNGKKKNSPNNNCSKKN